MREPLALKYRPKRFTDIVGQKATRAVLAKMVGSCELPASMIFAGVRGTGKTSAARIVAKAINCTYRDEYEPCEECSDCIAAETETAPYIVEVDAASRGTAEAMRQLVEDAQYAAGRHWKVFVLDEVHSVSSQGFQVLLKTLEEPPPHTTFILVTTEPEKIPDTIQARSMYFRFSKITNADIHGRLQDVCLREPKRIQGVTDDGLQWITEAANGGMRDALMMLDQVSRLGAGVTVPILEGVFGEQSVGKWLDALLSGNPAKAVLVADELVSQHGSVSAMIDKALVTLRNVLLAKAGHGEMPSDVAAAGVRMSSAQVVEMIKRLWSMRAQIKTLGPDDRAAVVALSAEMTRTPVVEFDETTADMAQIKELLGRAAV